MDIFVTGASGFVGGAATRKLADTGYRVSAMSRSDASDRRIRDLGATPVRCDLETIDASHIGSVQAVIHCAAYVEDWGPKDAWYRGNVLGTQNVLTATKSAGVRRFIHIGTEAAIMHGQALHDADESVPLAPHSPYPYCATKAQAEASVRAANELGTFDTIVLRPRFIWGPGDTTLMPAVEAMVKAGKWTWISHGSAVTSTTHIQNLVHAIELALDKGKAGEPYFIVDDGTITLKAMISAMAKARGLSLPEKSMPTWIAEKLAGASEAIWRTFGLKGAPPVTRHAVMIMSRDCTLQGGRAARELGYQPVISRADGLAQLITA
jgi:nucleoside-diphosphate-sugar epimerase